MMEKNVTFIPPTKTMGGPDTENQAKKLRVAAYCRVSTDSDEQASSYEAQVEHYTDYIKSNPGWELAGIYADDGISGTDTKKREEFLRMISDCMDGKIDRVITKSISRFARNTIDCLQYIRQLKDMGIPVIFEKENINTMDSRGEILITIMASMAQQESESLSKNVKLGIQYRYQQGKVMVNTNWFLGYMKGEDGELVVDPEQAKIVKRIYREYLEGRSCQKIAEGLQADGIKNGAGSTKWWASNIQQILKNEKYVGDALLQKTYTVNLLTKKRAVNDGAMPQYYVENSQEAIVTKEDYQAVRKEMERRSRLRDADGHRKGYCGTYALTGVLACGNCGSPMRRVVWTNRGRKQAVWRCRDRMEKKECILPAVYETKLHDAVVKAVRQAAGPDDGIISEIEKNALEAVGADAGDIEKELQELQKELVERVDTGKPYNALSGRILELKEEKERISGIRMAEKERLKRARQLKEFLEGLKDGGLEYRDSLVRNYVEKIAVFPGRIEVTFKTGAEAVVEL